MTYSSYDGSHNGFDEYTGEEPLPERAAATGKPVLAIMGAEEQIIEEPSARLAEYRATVPGARTELIEGSGHSPNVEKPAETAGLILAFAAAEDAARGGAARHEVQKRLQNPERVRRRP